MKVGLWTFLAAGILIVEASWADIHCSAGLDSGAVNFAGIEEHHVDCDLISLDTAKFVAAESVDPHRVWYVNEGCSGLDEWNSDLDSDEVAVGLGVDCDRNTYWMVVLGDFFGVATEFDMFTGQKTGGAWPMPDTPNDSWGGLTIDVNQSGLKAYAVETDLDVVFEIDLQTGVHGCTFAIPDGPNAFNGGISDAVDPSLCGGATLVVASGRSSEGQVRRAVQVDCSGGACARWVLDDTPPCVEDKSEEFRSQQGDIRMAGLQSSQGKFFVRFEPGGPPRPAPVGSPLGIALTAILIAAAGFLTIRRGRA